MSDWDELYAFLNHPERSLRYGEIADFDTYKDVLEERAIKWVWFEAQDFNVDDWAFYLSHDDAIFRAKFIFESENRDFPTNKPNKHHALIIKTTETWYLIEATNRRYLQAGNKFAPQILALLQSWDGDHYQPREEVQEKIQELEKKDEQLFPEPEPIRVEVAGAILNFTTWDTALVVYVDCSLKGKEVEAVYKDKDWSFEYKAQVIERSAGGRTICATIFTRIPLVTDKLRNLQKTVKRVDCTVKFATIEETITLFKENVAELDLRGRRV